MKRSLSTLISVLVVTSGHAHAQDFGGAWDVNSVSQGQALKDSLARNAKAGGRHSSRHARAANNRTAQTCANGARCERRVRPIRA